MISRASLKPEITGDIDDEPAERNPTLHSPDRTIPQLHDQTKLTTTMIRASILMSQNCSMSPKVAPILKIFDHTSFHTEKSPHPAMAVFTLTITYGMLVPITTPFWPSTSGVSPSRSTSDALPRTKTLRAEIQPNEGSNNPKPAG